MSEGVGHAPWGRAGRTLGTHCGAGLAGPWARTAEQGWQDLRMSSVQRCGQTVGHQCAGTRTRGTVRGGPQHPCFPVSPGPALDSPIQLECRVLMCSLKPHPMDRGRRAPPSINHPEPWVPSHLASCATGLSNVPGLQDPSLAPEAHCDPPWVAE